MTTESLENGEVAKFLWIFVTDIAIGSVARMHLISVKVGTGDEMNPSGVE